MNPEAIFDGMGVDAITGVKLMDWLGVTAEELQVPQRFHRLQDIVQFLKQFPEDTQRFLISKSTRGKLVDKLDHFFEYTSLLKEKQAKEALLQNLDKERSAVEMSGDEILKRDVAQRSLQVSESLAKVKAEIEIYEK